MSSFRLCSNEELLAIFHHFDFVQKCQFRRCSRRWNQLLRSPAVYHTIVLHLSHARYLPPMEKVLTQAALHVVNLALIAVEDLRVATWFSQSWQKFGSKRLNPVDQFPAVGKPHTRRPLLCHWDSLRYGFVLPLYENDGFEQIELRYVRLRGEDVANNLYLAAVAVELHAMNHTIAAIFNHMDRRDARDLSIQLDEGRHVLKSSHCVRQLGFDATRACLADMARLVKANVAPLTRKQTKKMLARIRQCDDGQVQEVFDWLVKVYEPTKMVTGELSPWSFDYATSSALIGRMLCCLCAVTLD